jgi:hypothetical protein
MKTLKTLLIASAALSGAFVLSEPMPAYIAYGDIIATLPLQAATSDIIGVGRVTNAWEHGIVLSVDNYWHGDPGSNSLSIAMKTYQPPIANTPIVFFLSKYNKFFRIEPETLRYNKMLDIGLLERAYEPDGLRFFNNARSWFSVNETNAAMAVFSSNLVHAAKSSNTNMFYEVMRDGVRFNPPDSRINNDSMTTFLYCSYYMTTNFMEQIWSDPLMPGPVRAWINTGYYNKTQTWLPQF